MIFRMIAGLTYVLAVGCAGASAHVYGVDLSDTSWNKFFYAEKEKNVLVCSLGQTDELLLQKDPDDGKTHTVRRHKCDTINSVKFASMRSVKPRLSTSHYVALLTNSQVEKSDGIFHTVTKDQLSNEGGVKKITVKDGPQNVFACNADIRSLAISRKQDDPEFKIKADQDDFEQLRFGNCTQLNSVSVIEVEARTQGFEQLVLFYMVIK